MGTYQIISRKYRPQTFADVVEQKAVVTTLKNAIAHERVANAYLFCGCRGTGKTTLARIFAKAINCSERKDSEPCNECTSCKEITEGRSLDVLEIDGASNRGIDDIRELNDNAGYASSGGKVKIFIIDEVHMLTKEAFNALLKTLEEPPPNVKFFFATTEPQKVLPTILSRCQRFDLGRIELSAITEKLQTICTGEGVEIEREALSLIGKLGDGSMRDSESLLDQVICSLENPLTYDAVSNVLGAPKKDWFFSLDHAFATSNMQAAFTLAKTIYAGGKDVALVMEGLAEHYRNILLLKLGLSAPLSENEQGMYEQSASFYTEDQCHAILEQLTEWLKEGSKQPWKQIHIEMVILTILRMKNHISITSLIASLEAMKQGAAEANIQDTTPVPTAPQTHIPAPTPPDLAPKAATPAQEVKAPVVPTPASKPEEHTSPSLAKRQRAESLMRFASVELNGSVKK